MKIGLTQELINRSVQAIFITGTLLSIVFGINNLINADPTVKDIPLWPWIMLAIFIALESARASFWRVIQRYDVLPRDRERASIYKFFFYGNRIVIFIFLLSGLWAVVSISLDKGAGVLYVYQTVGVVILVLWGVVFLSYFIWAVYFYNVNYGMPEEDWDKINDEKKKLTNGEHYKQEILDEEPKYNPYKDETFGLPPGTVRGMIAFTLLFGALCILFVRIGLKNEVDAGTVVWDQHEFFNNAFLMMIAFYFGSKSLEILTKKPALSNPGKTEETNKDNTVVTTPATTTTTATTPAKQEGRLVDDLSIKPETDPMTGQLL